MGKGRGKGENMQVISKNFEFSERGREVGERLVEFVPKRKESERGREIVGGEVVVGGVDREGREARREVINGPIESIFERKREEGEFIHRLREFFAKN